MLTVLIDVYLRFSLFLEAYSEIVKAKGKAVLLQAWTGPSGFKSLRLPEFLGNRHIKLAVTLP